MGGYILGKMTKNWMKTTKSAFLGKKVREYEGTRSLLAWWLWWGGGEGAGSCTNKL